MKNIYALGGKNGYGFLVLGVVIILLFLVSCGTQRKIDKAENLLVSTGKAAPFCAWHYPCKVTGTTTMSETDRAAYDSAMFEMQLQLWDKEVAFDSLASVIRLDSNCLKYLPALLLLKEENKKLKNQIAPPIIRTLTITKEVEDPAKIAVLEGALDGEIKLRVASETREKISKEEVKELKGKIKGKVLISWWWLAIAVAGIIGISTSKIYKGYKLFKSVKKIADV